MARRRLLYSNKFSEPFALDSEIVLYNSDTHKEIVIPVSKYNLTDFPKNIYTPIGVVVIPTFLSKEIYPTTHKCYGKPIMMSLKYMSCQHPDSGVTYSEGILWGDTNIAPMDVVDFEYINSETVAIYKNNRTQDEIVPYGFTDVVHVNTSNIGDYNGLVLESKAAPSTYYYGLGEASYAKASPSPFLWDNKKGWTANPEYCNIPWTGTVQRNTDGLGNTDILVWYSSNSHPGWASGIEISNYPDPGFFPLACCCRRYGTKANDSGQWYLPAMGELLCMTTFFPKHVEALTRIKTIYGSDIVAEFNGDQENNTVSSTASMRGVYIVYNKIYYYFSGCSCDVPAFCTRAFRPVNI